MQGLSASYTDYYQITMGQAYFLRQEHQQPAVFDYFFRKAPFSGGYAIFAGLHPLLEQLSAWQFSSEDIDYLYHQGLHHDYLEYLKSFRFQGNIHACREGEVVFPGAPILSVKANLIEAQLIETLLLNHLNFQSLIATKASRLRLASGHRKLLEFGLRRAPGTGGILGSRAAIVGGVDASSHVLACRNYNIPVSGTMAHAFIQSFPTEREAFRSFAEIWPDRCYLLVDTYNTLKSGIPNAIIVAKELEAKGHQLLGIRLDSGDLAYLAKQARTMLDEAGLSYVQIAVSNQLDEFVIKSLIEQEAPINAFGVGTRLASGLPDAALDGVYKLAECAGQPSIKLSDNIHKMTLPGEKQVYRLMDASGNFAGGDLIASKEENAEEITTLLHPWDTNKTRTITSFEKHALHHAVMTKGQSVTSPAVAEIKDYAQSRLQALPSEYKRFDNPHRYKVGVSPKLLKKRNALAEFYLHGEKTATPLA